MATSGSLLRWVQALTGGVELSVLDGEADRRPPGELLCLPYFLGEKTPLHDPELRGAFVGLHLGHDRGALHRAALEAIAYGVRHHVDVFGELGFAPRQAWVTDGGSRSRTFTQIVADVTGLSLRPVTDHPGASLGAAMLAAVSVGAVGSLDAATEVVRYGDAVEPDPQRSELYGDRYQLWRELGERLTPTSHALARRSR
jgi:xylulokinase